MDYSLSSSLFNENIFQIWEDQYPMGYFEEYGGVWMPLSYDYIKEILGNNVDFSNRGVMISNDIPPGFDGGGAPPITADPPFHSAFRKPLQSAFTSKSASDMVDVINEFCKEWDGDCGSDYGLHVALNTMAHLLGFDQEFFRKAVTDIFESFHEEPEVSYEKIMKYMNYIYDQMDNFSESDSLFSYIVKNGEGTKDQVAGTIMLMTIASIDTTWFTIANSLHYLATHENDLQSLVDNPELIDGYVDEFLRLYSGVSTARLISNDIDFHGYKMLKNQWVLIPLGAANRDVSNFKNGSNFCPIEPEKNHLAFGYGIHKCLGMHLGRLELKMGILNFIKKHPRFKISGDVVWSVGQVRGPKKLPLLYY